MTNVWTQFPSRGSELRVENRAAFVAGVREVDYPVVPEAVGAAVAALDRLEQLQSEAAAGVEVYCREVVDGIVAGRPLPKDFATGALKAEKAGEQQQAVHAAIRSVGEEIDLRFDGIVAAGLSDIAIGLRQRLDPVLKRLPGLVADLGDLDISAPAVVAGATEDQRAAVAQLEADQSEYTKVRELHLAAIRATAGARSFAPTRDEQTHLGLMWKQVIDEGLLEFSNIRLLGNVAPGSGLRRYLRLASREDVWLPTVAEIQQAYDSMHAREFEPASYDPVVYRDGQAIGYQNGQPMTEAQRHAQAVAESRLLRQVGEA